MHVFDVLFRWCEHSIWGTTLAHESLKSQSQIHIFHGICCIAFHDLPKNCDVTKELAYVSTLIQAKFISNADMI